MDYNPIMFWRNKIIGEMVPCLFEYHKVQTQRVPVKECKNSRELCLVLSVLLYTKFIKRGSYFYLDLQYAMFVSG